MKKKENTSSAYTNTKIKIAKEKLDKITQLK